jgi:hypothetical protein
MHLKIWQFLAIFIVLQNMFELCFDLLISVLNLEKVKNLMLLSPKYDTLMIPIQGGYCKTLGFLRPDINLLL